MMMSTPNSTPKVTENSAARRKAARDKQFGRATTSTQNPINTPPSSDPVEVVRTFQMTGLLTNNPHWEEVPNPITPVTNRGTQPMAQTDPTTPTEPQFVLVDETDDQTSGYETHQSDLAQDPLYEDHALTVESSMDASTPEENPLPREVMPWWRRTPC
jgi:hypothetical protein